MRRLSLGMTVLLAVGLAVTEAAPSAHHDQPGTQGIRFNWAFGALKKGKQKPELVAVTRDTTLKTGDELKMLLEIKERCYAYVIYQGPQDQIRLLFPYALSDLGKGYQASRVYRIPRGERWFELDKQVGSETFHLLVSTVRLLTLERLIGDYGSVGSEDKPALAAEILAEIRRLMREHRSLKAPAERPVQIVGRVRGTDSPDKGHSGLEELAIEISAETFYSRTFTIDHK